MTVSREPKGEWWIVAPPPTGPFDGVVDFSRELAAAIGAIEPARVVNGHDALGDAAEARGIFLQYSPPAFVNANLPALLWNIARLKARGIPVVTTVHEYWSPASGSIKREVWRWLCRRALSAVAARSSHLVVTTPYAGQFLADAGIELASTAAVIPVGTNIPAVTSDRQPAASAAAHRVTIAMFGQPAIFDREVTLAMARWIERLNPRPRLVWNARSPDEMRRWWRDLGAPDVVEIAGGQSAEDVATTLARADLAVALHDDGASTRRSTVAASIAAGLPVVALDGRFTDDRLRTSGAFLFSPIGDAPPFIANLERAVGDAALRQEMAAASQRLFASDLSWPRIAEQYLAFARVRPARS